MKYVVTIRENLGQTKDKTVDASDPMMAHKQVYMTMRSDADIMTIADNDGNVVYELKSGFRRLK